MKRWIFGCALACMGLWSACDDYDKWSSDTKWRLTLSQDTVAWDTLISTIPSSTRLLTLYNQSDYGLRIPHIYLAAKSNSCFRANVDGQALVNGEGSDFEVRQRDSLMIRLECTLPTTGMSTPVRITDELIIQLESGVEQRIVLTADAQDAYMIRGLVLEQDSVFATDKPYVVYDSLVVASSSTLVLPAGATLMFHKGVGLRVEGTLEAQGSLEAPVTFRGDRTDRMFPYLPYDNTPGRWGGIHFTSTSGDNKMTYCDVHAGSYGIKCDSADVASPLLTMENCVVHNVAGDGLHASNCMIYAANSQFSNTLGYTVYLYGGVYDFVHCTIAQFYPFDNARGPALFLANRVNEEYRHLERAHFYNSVITGYGDDVIMGSIIEGQDYVCDYLFDHCFLNTPKVENDTRYVQVVWDDEDLELRHEKNFTLFDTYNFLYDFTPDSLSAIRNMGDPAHAIHYTSDRMGRSRTEDEAPDAGCYEYYEKE